MTTQQYYRYHMTDRCLNGKIFETDIIHYDKICLYGNIQIDSSFTIIPSAASDLVGVSSLLCCGETELLVESRPRVCVCVCARARYPGAHVRHER